jgi:hypothetical protein
MKKLALLTLSLIAGAGVALAASSADTAAPNNQHTLQQAQQMAKYLPQTLVVRKDRMGHVEIFHSMQKLTSQAQLPRNAKFTSQFSKAPQGPNHDPAAFWWGGWNFWWGYPYSYPTYGLYSPYYGFNYNYNYYPYYSYPGYDGWNYWYYGWRW